MIQTRLPDGFAVQVDRRVQGAGPGFGFAGWIADPDIAAGARRPGHARRRPAEGPRRGERRVGADAARRDGGSSATRRRPVASRRDRRYTGARQHIWIAATGHLAARTAHRHRGRRVVDADPERRLRRGTCRHRDSAAHPEQGPGGGPQYRPRRLQNGLCRVPGLRCGPSPWLARGAARALLRSDRGTGCPADRRALADRSFGRPLRGGAFVVGSRSPGSSGDSLYQRLLRAQRRNHLPHYGIARYRWFRRNAAVR